MLKSHHELSKDERVSLLKRIANHEIDPALLKDKKVLFASKHGDYFLGLQIRADNEDLEVVCIDEALRDEQSSVFIVVTEKDSKTFFKCLRSGRLYSFDEMMRLKDVNFDLTFFLSDEITQVAYLRCLEKWC